MSSAPSIETLRAWLQRDQESFKAFDNRLTELQNARPEDVKPSDRFALNQYDRSVITECDRHLTAMEDIPSPTAEERQIMQELNKLVNLGDRMLERKNLVMEELEAKLGAVDLTPVELPKKAKKAGAATTASVPVPAAATPASPAAACPIPAKPVEALPPKAADPIVLSSPEPVVLNESPTMTPQNTRTGHEPAPQVHPPFVQAAASAAPSSSKAATVEDEAPEAKAVADEEEQEEDTPAADPKDIYKVLGVSHDAPMNEVKKAIRRQKALLHPDRFLGDPDAGAKFSDFSALCVVFDTEERRAEYDKTGSAQVLKGRNVAKMMRNLTM